ncbi:MAG: aromatic ring-hydroxylating dioxygenase subunit alpha [Porticoccaceae bacterium]
MSIEVNKALFEKARTHQPLNQPALSEYVRIQEDLGRFEVDQRAYMDEAVFKKERDTIFSKCWLYIGHESEIRNPKDYLTRTVGGYDLIFHRNRKGDVKAFHNYCTHRGPILEVEEHGSKNVFTCPYHGWVFDGEGKLRDYGASCGYEANFNADGRYNLEEVPRLDQYRGFYFINFNPKAIDLKSYLAGATDFLDLMVDQAPEGKGLEIISGEQGLVNGGNWKVITDNFVDSYHGPSLHSSYFFNYAPKRTENAQLISGFVGDAGGLGNGHNYFENQLGLGRPVAVWIPAFGEETKPLIEAHGEELRAKWGEEKGARITASNRNMVIFPNLVITDNISMSVRSVYPETVDSFRMNIWAVGIEGEHESVRDVRLRNHLSFVGPAGFAHPDDFEIFERQRRAYHTTPAKWFDFSKGMASGTDVIEDGDRRKVRGHMMDESQQRAWWTQWDRIIAGAESLSVEE